MIKNHQKKINKNHLKKDNHLSIKLIRKLIKI